MPYRQLVGVGPDGRMVINDTDPDLLAAHEALTISAHGIGGEWFSTYLDRGITRSGITAGQAGYFFEEFTDVSRWHETAGGAATFVADVTHTGGVANLFPAAADDVSFENGSAAFGSPRIALANGRFYIGARMRLNAGFAADGFATVGIYNGIASRLLVGIFPITPGVWSLTMLGTGAPEVIVSSVAVDANWHDFEAWCDSANHYFLSVDGETPVMLTGVNPPGPDASFAAIAASGGSTGLSVDYDKALWVFPQAA